MSYVTIRVNRKSRAYYGYLSGRGFSVARCRCGTYCTQSTTCNGCQRRSKLRAAKRAAKQDHYIDPKTGKCRVCFKYSDPYSRLRHNTRASCAVCKRGRKKLHQHWLYDVPDHEMSWGPRGPTPATARRWTRR